MHKINTHLYKYFGGANVSIIFLIVTVLVWQLPPNNPSNIFIKNLIFTLEIVLVIALYRWHQTINVESRTLYQFHARNKVDTIDKIILVIFAYCVDRYISPAFKFGDNPQNEERIIREMSHQSVWEGLYKTGIKAPIIEEIVFRGLLYSAIVLAILYILKANIEDYSHRLIATYIFVLLSSFIFGYLHISSYGDYENIGVYILPGIIFSTVFILTKNIMYSIMVHMLGNVVGTLNTYHDKLHEIALPIDEYLNIILIIILLLLLIERTARGFNYIMRHKEENKQLSTKELLRWICRRLKQHYIYSEN
ncbi:CPBP family intramembrane metalloprotease [Staphylococcus epidermidis]|nr:CPBP family intramembrane metalloprotease [Staphylococcus epidermidis]